MPRTVTAATSSEIINDVSDASIVETVNDGDAERALDYVAERRKTLLDRLAR